jgi:mRNA (guanine-N7-)-methyltransferase
MSGSRIPQAARRRSSAAYDPARDTFREIPDTVPEHAIAEGYAGDDTSSPAQNNERKRKQDSSAGDDQGHAVAHHQSETGEPATKKARSSPSEGDRKPKNPMDLPRVAKRPREEGEVRSRANPPSVYSRRPEPNGQQRRRSRSPARRVPDAYRRRSPPRRERPRDPSPIRRSPPRNQGVRPGAGRGRGRNVLAEQQRLQAEREARTGSHNANNGVQNASNQFYNSRPEWVKERGRDWRKNESQIKGLRSFNNWIKSFMIQKFSPEEKTEPEELGWGEEAKAPEQLQPLLVLDVGCGKGGDLGKWQQAPQPVELYVGLDPAEISIKQASDRYNGMRRGRKPMFEARFVTKDCFGEWIGEVPIVQEVGIDPNVGSGAISRFGGGRFDVVTMMFSMHYSFESEEKVKMMLKNVAGSLKKGGRFIGVCPNSDSLADNIKKWFVKYRPDAQAQANGEPVSPKTTSDGDDEGPHWGNSIYNVRFPSTATTALTPTADGTVQFRPPVGWKYTFWMAEAVDVPEFVVPWEAFRAIAEGFNLEQRYRKPFLEIWDAEKGDHEMHGLARRMGVLDDRGGMAMSEEEREAVSFYHGFCFVKV